MAVPTSGSCCSGGSGRTSLRCAQHRWRGSELLRLLERKRRLLRIMPTIETRLLYLDHIEHRGRDLFRAACERDLEGVVAKCARGTYRLTAAPRPGSRSRIPITRRCATATSCSLRARLLHIEVGHWAAPTFCFGDPESPSTTTRQFAPRFRVGNPSYSRDSGLHQTSLVRVSRSRCDEVQSLDKWLKAQKEEEGEVGGGGADDILSSRPPKTDNQCGRRREGRHHEHHERMPRVDDALELALPMRYLCLACNIEQTRKCARGRLSPGRSTFPVVGFKMEISAYRRSNMSHVSSRVCTLFVMLGTLGMAACASPSTPSATPSPGAVPSELMAISPGVTDTTLGNNGWTCIDPNPSLTVCVPPGLGFPPRPPIPNNGGAPTYTVWAFHNHVYDHRVKFIRPDLYQGQPCQGDEPYTLFEPVNYYECIIPAR
jgi:hypothetical protein